MPKPKSKRHYGVQCSECKDKIFSTSRHDFHHCKCGNTFIDGGYDYLRYGSEKGKPKRVFILEPKEQIEKSLNKDEGWPYQ